MIELLVVGALTVAGFAVFGLLWAVVSLVCWLLFLPFKLLGLAFKGLAFLLAAPFLLIAGLLGATVLAVGFLLFLTPALPFALIALGIWWLLRRRSSHHPAPGQA